jgi:hypothetical protein
MAGQRDFASGRVLGMLFRRSQEMADEKNYELLNAIDLQKRATWGDCQPAVRVIPVRETQTAGVSVAISGLLTEAIKGRRIGLDVACERVGPRPQANNFFSNSDIAWPIRAISMFPLVWS